MAPHLLADSNPLKVNPQILSRCRTEEQLRRLRSRIRTVLEKSVRVKVYHPLQFKYRRFLELPYLSIPPILELKRRRDSSILFLHEAITQELGRLLYGVTPPGGDGAPVSAAAAAAASASSSKVHFVLHLINTAVDSPRFESLELAPNIYLGEVLRRKGGGGGGGLEASLYILAVPERPALFSSPAQHDELLRTYCLLFIKYFPSLTRSTRGMQQAHKSGQQLQLQQLQQQQQQQLLQQHQHQGGVADSHEELVICLDVVYVPFDWKIRDLEPHVYRLIHQGIVDGVIKECPSRAAEVARLVSSYPASLPPLSSSLPYSSPLVSPLPQPHKGEPYPSLVWRQGASVAAAAAAAAAAAGTLPPAGNALQLTACLELDGSDKISTNRLFPRKSLKNSKLFSGDLLVFSLDLPPSLMELKEAQQRIGGRPEDLAPVQAYYPASPAEEGHAALEAAAAAAAAAAGGGDSSSNVALVPWNGSPPKEVRGLSLLPFVPLSRGGAIPPSPPALPSYVCNDFVEYCLEKQGTEIYHVRLYDPYEFLGKSMSCSGRLLAQPSTAAANPVACEASVSSLVSEGSLVSLAGSEAGAATAAAATAGGGAANEPVEGAPLPLPQHPTADTGTATLGAPPSEAQDTGAPSVKSKAEETEEETAGAAAPSPIADDPWLHMPNAKPICVKEFSLSGRLPVRQALQWIAWQFGVDPSRLVLFPEPPLLSDRKVQPLDLDAFIVSNEGTWETQQQQLLQRGGDTRDAAGRRQLTLEEAHIQLQAAQSWPGCLDRRRSLAAATNAGRLPRELHLCLLPHHFRLCTRTVNALLLHPQQQQQLQQLLLSPLPPAALSPSSLPAASTVFNYICLIFTRQAERIGCVTGLIPASNAEGRPHTAADLMSEILARLPPSVAQTLKQDYRNSSTAATAAAAPSSSATAAAATGDRAYEEDFGPLRLSISDASHLVCIPPGEQLSWLSLYAPATQSRARDAVLNLLAVPLRLEADYTPEEEELIRSGQKKVLLVQHQTPGDREPFGYPFEILVEPDATLSEIKAHIVRKLKLPKNAWGSCTFFQVTDGIRSFVCLLFRCWKGPNDTLDWGKHNNLGLVAAATISAAALAALAAALAAAALAAASALGAGSSRFAAAKERCQSWCVYGRRLVMMETLRSREANFFLP
ncbi:hypothetical protein ACSSS7_003879 [Eimeria intestinalis]